VEKLERQSVLQDAATRHLPAEFNEDLKKLKDLVEEANEKRQKAEAFAPRRPPPEKLEVITIEEGVGHRKPLEHGKVKLRYAVVLREDSSLLDAKQDYEYVVDETEHGVGEVLPSLLNELLRPLRRGQVVSTTTTLGKIFPEKAPAIVQHGPEAVAVIEVGLLQIFVTKDCSFTKGSGEIVKEVIKDGVGPWCNNPSDEGLAILRIEKLRTAEGECLFPRPGDSPLELSITVGDGQVCDALECAVLEMRPHETALVTCRDPSFLAGGAPLGEAPHLPRTTAFTFRVSLLDFNPGPDAPSFDEEDRVPFALRRKAEANRLFKEGRFRLARQRYFEITQLFHHLDKPELKDRFLGQPELFQECRKLRIECRLNMAACGIKLQDPRAAKEACQLVLQQMPENTKAFYRLAQAHLQERDFDQACKNLNRLLEIDPSIQEARRLLQKAVQLRNNADKKQKGEVKFDRMIGCGSDLRREPHFNS